MTTVAKEKFKNEAELSWLNAGTPVLLSSPSPGPVNGPGVMISVGLVVPGPVPGPAVMISMGVVGVSVTISEGVVSGTVLVVPVIPVGGAEVTSGHPDPDPSPEPSPDIHPEPSGLISGRGTSTRSKYRHLSGTVDTQSSSSRLQP